jgi:hypothetical protein
LPDFDNGLSGGVVGQMRTEKVSLRNPASRFQPILKKRFTAILSQAAWESAAAFAMLK